MLTSLATLIICALNGSPRALVRDSSCSVGRGGLGAGVGRSRGPNTEPISRRWFFFRSSASLGSRGALPKTETEPCEAVFDPYRFAKIILYIKKFIWFMIFLVLFYNLRCNKINI